MAFLSRRMYPHEFTPMSVVILLLLSGFTSSSVYAAIQLPGQQIFQAARQVQPGAIKFGKAPIAVAMGDFNGDGKLDLVAVNEEDDTVGVRLGRGDGTFAPRITYSPGRGSVSVAVGDLNGDAIPDFAIANLTENIVSIFLGKGDGTFKTNTVRVSGQAVNAVAGIPFTGPVASVIGAEHASDLKATINWGDGSLVSSGTVSGTDPYTISGTHTYTTVGMYTITVIVTDSNLDSTSFGKATATVTNP